MGIYPFKKGRNSFLAGTIFLCLVLSGCDFYNKRLNPEVFDSDTNLSRQEYKDFLTKPQQPKMLAAEPAIPPLHDITFIPPIYDLPETKRVSISVTQDVPLKEVLFELSRKSGMNFKLDSNIEGGINFTAYNEPFIEVIEGITQAAGLRYRFESNFLKIEQDTPYFTNYQVNFLNLLRRGSSQTSISTDVFSGSFGGEGGGGSSADNGSNSVVESTSDADFWLVVESNIAKMLNDSSGGAEDPLSTALSIPGQEVSRERAGIGTGLRVGPYSRITSNRQAGLISVFATESEHRRIIDFLNTLRERVNSQVTVQAKILEVTLDDNYSNGINWQTLFDAGSAAVSSRARFNSDIIANPITGFADSADNEFSVGVSTSDFSAVINAVESFGSTRTLSSPRITIINNQPAIMKVAENQVFFQLEFERVEGTIEEADRVNTSSKILTVPVGLVMALQPAIDKANQKIMLNLRPTISRIQSFVNDPAVSIQSNNTVTSAIPVVEVREIDSVVHMDSGQVVLMGGLMQERTRNVDQGLPWVSRLPFWNVLAGSRQQDKEVVELVILLKAEIVENGTVDAHDMALYEKFISDPRAIGF